MLADRTALLSPRGFHFRNCRSFIHGYRFGVLGRFHLCEPLPEVRVLRRHDQVAVADKVAKQNSTMSRRCQLQVRAENLLLKRILITLIREVVQLIEQLLEQVAKVGCGSRKSLFQSENYLAGHTAAILLSGQLNALPKWSGQVQLELVRFVFRRHSRIMHEEPD